MRERRDIVTLAAGASLVLLPMSFAWSCSDTVRLEGDGGVYAVDVAEAGDAATPDATPPDAPGDIGAVRIDDGIGRTCALALDGGTLFGVTYGSETEPARLWRLRSGVATEVAAVTPADAFASSPCLLAVGGGAAWWQPPFAPGVWRTSLETGETRAVHSAGVAGVAVGAGYAWWTVHGEGTVYRAALSGDGVGRFADVQTPTGVVASADRVWVLDRLGATLFELDPETGTTESFAWWLGDNTMTLALGPNDLVWPSHSSGLLHAVSVDGGAVRTIGEGAAGPMAVTSLHAFTAPGQYDFARELRRVALDGADTEVLATVGAECAVGLTADEDAAWWTDCDGAIWRRELPGSR